MCPAVANKSAIKQSSYHCIECAESSAYQYDHQQKKIPNLVLIAPDSHLRAFDKIKLPFLASAKYFQTKEAFSLIWFCCPFPVTIIAPVSVLESRFIACFILVPLYTSMVKV
jgi:hypothetical protein